MPEFRYTLDYDRTYHDLGVVTPGTVIDAGEPPDRHWKPVHHKTAKATGRGHQHEPKATAAGDPASEE